MTEELQAATPEEVVQSSEAPEQEVNTGEADTPEVEETDEQKNERIQREAQERSEKRAKGVQKRMDELTADKYAERKRADDLASLNARLFALIEQKPTQVQATGEPQREAYDNDVDWLRAVARYDAQQTAKELVEAQRKQQSEETQKSRHQQEMDTIQRDFIQRRLEAEKTIPDFKEVIADWQPNLPPNVEEMIARLPEGPMIAYHLAKTPELEAQFVNSPAFMHGILLGQMLTTIKASAKPSSAPAPGKPVASKAGTSTEPPSDPALYRAWADKHLK